MSRPPKAIPASTSEQMQKRLREVAFLLLLPVVVYLLACLLSYSPQDPGWSHAGEPEHIHNFGGAVGAWIADLSLYFFGGLAYVFPLLLLAVGAGILRPRAEAPGLGAAPAKG